MFFWICFKKLLLLLIKFDCFWVDFCFRDIKRVEFVWMEEFLLLNVFVGIIFVLMFGGGGVLGVGGMVWIGLELIVEGKGGSGKLFFCVLGNDWRMVDIWVNIFLDGYCFG